MELWIEALCLKENSNYNFCRKSHKVATASVASKIIIVDDSSMRGVYSQCSLSQNITTTPTHGTTCSKFTNTITWYLLHLSPKHNNCQCYSTSLQMFVSSQLMVNKVSISCRWSTGALRSCSRNCVSCRYSSSRSIWKGRSVTSNRCLPCWRITMWRYVVNCLWRL